MVVYLIHFHNKLFHAQHYIGFSENGLVNRINNHRKGTGAKILNALNKKGIDYSVVRIWNGKGRDFERSLKKRKNTKNLCPICSPNKNQAKL